MINVTNTYLPPLKEYDEYLKKIWQNGWITNGGEFVQKLEEKLKKYLKVNDLFLINNGTTALQIAIKSLGKEGEIITTPFSYVATTSAVIWSNCKPVFVDINSDDLTVNPKLIENKITKNTIAILATHVYGNPCDIDMINKIARRHKLRVIYDAAHSFSVEYKNKPLISYGDVSILSFHATKLFHTIEGGAIIANNKTLAHKIAYMRNFGHNGEEDYFGIGINGKMTEMQAAMGLCLLPKMSVLIKKRKYISKVYDSFIKQCRNKINKPKIREKTVYNYAYYPIIFQSEKILIKTKKALNKKNIFPRRYFYPSLNKLPYLDYQKVEISEDISKRVLCLPLSHELNNENIKIICKIIKANI